MCNSLTIRNARKEDANEIAVLLLSAWPVDAFLSMSDDLDEQGLVSIIASYIIAEDNLYSYHNIIVAAVPDGQGGEIIAGAINCYAGEDFRRLKQPIIADLISRFGDVPYASVDETEAGEFYLDSIGVRQDMRKMGIGTVLLNAAIERGFSLGHRNFGLLVDYDKPSAEALYYKVGFRHSGDKDFLGHKMKHMLLSQKHH